MKSCRGFSAVLFFFGVLFSLQILKGEAPAAPVFDDFTPVMTQGNTFQQSLECLISEAEDCYHCCHGSAHHTSFLGAARAPMPVELIGSPVFVPPGAPLEINIFPVDHQPPKTLS